MEASSYRVTRANNASSVREDWYVHETLLEKERLDKILNHMKNRPNLNLTNCLNIVLQVYEIEV